MIKCEYCNFNYCSKNFTKHIKTKKHKLQVEQSGQSVNCIDNSSMEYVCKICDKTYLNNIWYSKHLNSEKHKNKIKINDDFRVPVINIENTSIKYGKNAPLNSKIDKWLIRNPNYKVYKEYKVRDDDFLLNIKKELIKLINLIDTIK